jgi:hypothetical protein
VDTESVAWLRPYARSEEVIFKDLVRRAAQRHHVGRGLARFAAYGLGLLNARSGTASRRPPDGRIRNPCAKRP